LLLGEYSDTFIKMASSGDLFDNLVAKLSKEERGLLLERIRSSMPVSAEPLYSAQAAPGTADALSAKLDELGLLTRLLLFLRGLFSGKSKEELLREDELREIGHHIEMHYPGLVDRRRGVILAPAAEALRGLRDASRFFYDALDRSVERDKSAFYAFLASLEIPDTHERLSDETDPANIAASLTLTRGGFGETELRSSAMAAYEAIFSDLPEKGRHAMYQDLRSVLFLKRLSGFLFDRLIMTFREGAGPSGQTAASFYEARDLLLDLGDILFSMSEPPSTSLMEAIFFFADREELGKRESDAAAVLGADMVKASSALDRIRSFNSSLPLRDLLRLVSGDPRYAPKELPGGEDWLATYKTFWRERIDSSLGVWRSEHRNKALVEEMAAFVGEPGPAGFQHISNKEEGEGPPVPIAIALTFLDAFYRGPFLRELNRPMKIVLVDGEFYRKDNRVEYTDAYDALLRIPEFLTTLDARLGPEGELGATWVSAISEMGATAVKRRRMQTVARSAEEEAERIVRRVGFALRTMTRILQGFLKGEAGGRYDSLSNLSYIDGKANKDFVRSLDKAKDRCERAFAFLSELSGMDLSADE
jgi:hypothetical protein